MLNQEEIDFFWDHGYLHIPEVFAPEETAELATEMDWLIETWADRSSGWSGPWRKDYMDDETEQKSKLIAMHDLHLYSVAWMRVVTSPRLCAAMIGLLGTRVELHHSTMHVKPPETGHPFPMHQDWAFYKHGDNRYVDVLVHMDDTCHRNGEIRFMNASHKGDALEHITKNPDGSGCTPHLPTDRYHLKDTVAVPAKAGDVVCFNIHTIHGSHINQTDRPRRMVRIGYRHPENKQLSGQSMGRPGLMVGGRRERISDQPVFSTAGPAQ
ncbi:MAG: phytanoyl-CoA dioxygenase family protein [Planctomycetota bacterium]|jgi:ectoine hydroxylase-related dioxygenase (phytanoyl-CoA dioxygenase family)|nr:phytanoyl-CoA dioxygenase family protein [Planctomycetota bacterium]MDP7131443.1 phytanoyl-CoA dioxygenase family protein [Planctomycetota bacterium]MDP7254836.1 phytanoyl-CoA dioxygenase family protein [Planctomycetota bacterium]